MHERNIRRRDLLFASALGTIGATRMLAVPELQVSSRKIDTEETDPNAQAFWSALGTKQAVTPKGSGNTHGFAPDTQIADPQRAPIFLYVKDPTDSTKWIRANKIAKSELLVTNPQKNANGDVNIKIRVNAVKLSQADQNAFGTIQNGSLRIDVGQTEPFGPSVGNLIWTAFGSIWPTLGGKLPPTPTLNFDLGDTWNQVPKKVTPLPRGGGSLLWNFFVNKEPSTLSKVFNALKGAASNTAVVLPLLGLPGYALSAFTAFNKLFGAIPQTPKYLFQHISWEDVACTQAAADANAALNPSGSVALIDGKQYIVVPTSHADSFVKQISMKKYLLENGRIILPGDPIAETAALKYFTDTTYATFTVSVKEGLS
jgi:hypothetical protein